MKTPIFPFPSTLKFINSIIFQQTFLILTYQNQFLHLYQDKIY